jgi:Fe-Mn family superoxide dismutase
MMNRRTALRTLALSAGAATIARGGLIAAAGAAAQGAPAAAKPAAPPAATPVTPPAPIGPFTLPPLPYAFDALEPHLDAQTMQIHHDKHHAAYVTNLNKAVADKPDLQKRSVEDLLRGLDTLPADVKTAIRNHGGGHYNHSLLWTSLKNGGAAAPSGELAGAIDKAFGSFTSFQDKFNSTAMSVFGSGWAWLTYSKSGSVAISALPNQDAVVTAGLVPLLGIDVWEHAYYLKFQNRRADYVAEFAKVVDWDMISSRYRDALKG